MRLRVSLGAVFGSLLVLSSPGLAQNLVAGGDFNSGIGLPWVSYGSAVPALGARSWSTSDAAGSGSSGSALMTISAAAPSGTVIGLSQCVDISAEPPGSTYNYFSNVVSPGTQNAESRGVVEVAFFSDTACTTFLNLAEGQGGSVALAPPAGPPWPTFPGSASAGSNEGSATAPVGAVGLQVRIYLERLAGSSQQELQFDLTTVHRQGTTPVSLMTFEIE